MTSRRRANSLRIRIRRNARYIQRECLLDRAVTLTLGSVNIISRYVNSHHCSNSLLFFIVCKYRRYGATRVHSSTDSRSRSNASERSTIVTDGGYDATRYAVSRSAYQDCLVLFKCRKRRSEFWITLGFQSRYSIIRLSILSSFASGVFVESRRHIRREIVPRIFRALSLANGGGGE